MGIYIRKLDVLTFTEELVASMELYKKKKQKSEQLDGPQNESKR